MIYQKLIVTDQSNDGLVMTKILFYAPQRLAPLFGVIQRRINLLEKIYE